MESLRHVMLMAGLVALVVWIILAWRRAVEKRRRWKHDLCSQCGYDVRANAERCPECGKPIVRFPVDSSAFTLPRQPPPPTH